MMENMLNGMFGSVEPGLCRLSMNGGIAIKTSSGYKSYNVKTGKLTNCNNFVLNIGQDFFFVIPTNKAQVGDIILVNKKPVCVIEVGKSTLKVINYETATVQDILPERHVFMGNTYFYGKIVSMFGSTDFVKSKKGTGKILKYMMMSEIMKGMSGVTDVHGNTKGLGGMSGMNMMPLLMMGGGMGDMFEGLFSNDEDSIMCDIFNNDDDDTDDESEEE